MTTAPPLPFKVDGKPIRVPRRTPPRGVQRPVWSDYRVKVPVNCDHCAQVAYETVLTGEGHEGMRKARRKRRQGGDNLLLCHEHARAQQEKDKADYPEGQTVRGSGNRGKRYIA